MTDYREGSLQDHPDLHEPDSAEVRCECGYWGECRVHMTSPGCYGSIQGPPEPATFVASCPSCGATIELDENTSEPEPPDEDAQ